MIDEDDTKDEDKKEEEDKTDKKVELGEDDDEDIIGRVADFFMKVLRKLIYFSYILVIDIFSTKEYFNS